MRPSEMAHACNPSTLGGKVGGSAEVRSLRPTWPTGRNTGSAKNTKVAEYGVHAYNPSYLGGWDRKIAWTQEVEVAVSQNWAIVLQPGQQGKIPSQKEKERKKESFLTRSQSPEVDRC